MFAKLSSVLPILSLALPIAVSAAGAPLVLPIHPNGDETKCLDVRGGIFADGTPVQIFDCNGTPAQMWQIQPGTTAVTTDEGRFCLDAGSTPANGVGMKIWECFEGLAAQTWFLTGDKRIALQNQGLCLDLPNGVHADSVQVQTWKCTDNDTNQIWDSQA